MHTLLKMNDQEEKPACSSKLVDVSKTLFLAQGLVIAGTGNVGILTYNNCAEIKCVHLNSVSWLIAIHAYCHIAAASLCFTRACAKCPSSIYKVLLAIIIWSIWLTGFLIYEVLQVYKYEQDPTFPFWMVTVLTAIYELLVIGIVLLLICHRKDRNEKSTKLLQH